MGISLYNQYPVSGMTNIHIWYLLEKSSVQRVFLDYATGIARTCTKYVHDTPTDHTNVSKLGHKGRANCLCIFPKTKYLSKAVLLNDFASTKPLESHFSQQLL